MSGQTGSHLEIFLKEDFFNGTGETAVTKDTSTVSGLVDLDFYHKTYFIPYDYPTQFVNHRFKNQTHIEWSDSSRTRNYQKNWTHSFRYDERSRVTEYSYSSCAICSQFAYTVKIYYDVEDRPIKLEMGHDERKSDGTAGYEVRDVYLLGYDTQGNIAKLEKYNYGKLAVRITKM